MSWWLIALLVYTHGFVFNFGAGLMLTVIAHSAKASDKEIIGLMEATCRKSFLWPYYFVVGLFK